MVSAISAQTGKVVDIEMKSKVCYNCRAKSNLDVNLFNSGAKTLQSVLEGLHLETGGHCRSGFTTNDQQRLYAAGQKALDATKVRRQIHRSQRKSRNEQNEEKEGPTYFNEFYLINMT